MTSTYDLVLDPMTLILNPDLDTFKIYLYTKNDLPSFRLSKVIAMFSYNLYHDL